LFGLACIPALYALGRQVSTRREALLACALLTVSYHHVWFSQNARGYTGLLACTLVATTALMRGLDAASSRKGWSWCIAYAVATALGIYTHLTMAFVSAAHAVICVVLLVRRRGGQPAALRWQPLAFAFALAVVLTLTLYAPVLSQFPASYAPGRPIAAAAATWRWTLLETIRGLRIGLGSLAVLVAAVLAAAGAWSYARQRWVVAALFAVPGVLVTGAALVLGWPLRPRFFFFLLGYVFLVLVRGATAAAGALARVLRSSVPAVSEPLLTTLIVGLLVAGSALALSRNYRLPKQDFEGAIRFVESARADGEPIATVPMGSHVYRDYFGKRWALLDSAESLRALQATGRRVWVLHTLPTAVAAGWPDVPPALERDCAPVRVFPGTVGDGDIVVCVAAPVVP
jgi:4-amino-4-deoxy-L-arabinose transferase-like glycosyltransferase